VFAKNFRGWLKYWMNIRHGERNRLLIPRDSHSSLQGDARLSRRLAHSATRIGEGPGKSFPKIFPAKAELDGFYRLINNPRMSSARVLGPEISLAAGRAMQHPLVVAVHDTTTFCFPAEHSIEGLGPITTKSQGFFGHFCLGVTTDRYVLGVLGLKTWVRSWERKGKRNAKQIRADETNEKLRWGESIQDVHGILNEHPQVIHVTDREGDDYTLFHDLVEQGIRFVIRLTYDRRLYKEQQPKLSEALEPLQPICCREVFLSERRMRKYGGGTGGAGARASRMARLGFAAKALNIRRGWHADSKLPCSMRLNVVRVFEVDAPKGEEPVEWLLVTTEPISTAEELTRIVDIYRSRWTIEEYFKALKTGCAFEERGLQSIGALLNTLAIFAPIACNLYNLKTFGRTQPDIDCKAVLTPTQIQLLENSNPKKPCSVKTMADAMWAIAQLGGHIKKNGLPGWQVLARGYEELLLLERGWLMAMQQLTERHMERSDM
jgi:hypothetical protein